MKETGKIKKKRKEKKEKRRGEKKKENKEKANKKVVGVDKPYIIISILDKSTPRAPACQ